MNAAGFDPLDPYPGAAKRWKCRCRVCGEVSYPRYSNVKAGSRCEHCAPQRISRTRRTPEAQASAEMLKARFKPLEPFPGANERWKSWCLRCDAVVYPALSKIRKRVATGCKHCSSGQHLRVPDEVAEAEIRQAGFIPLEPYPRANDRWLCRCCTCGAEVRPSLFGVRAGKGCTTCGRRARSKVLGDPGYDEEESVAAEAEMLAAGITPVEPYPGRTDLPWRCRCRCQRDVVKRLTWVRAGSVGCMTCAPGGRQRVDDEQAEAEMRRANWEPLGPYSGSETPWLSHCRSCGAEGSPTLKSVRAAPKRHGCRSCARATVDRRLPQQDAVELMQSAGMDPLVEYTSMNTPWTSRCYLCENVSDPTLGNVYNRARWGCRWLRDPRDRLHRSLAGLPDHA